MQKTIQLEVKIKPENLHADLEKHILLKLKFELTNTCSKKNGTIIEVMKIISIVDKLISNSSSDIICLVSLVVCVFIPEVDKTYNASVLNVYTEGVMLEINKIQKILVPKKTYNEIHYVSGDVVKVKITDIMYYGNKFSCIGKFA